MRRLIRTSSFLSLLLLVTWFTAGCGRKQKRSGTAEEETGLASMVHVADPHSTLQLVRGFYAVEQNAWRWTMGKFTVLLKPPAGAAQKGATLLLKFSVPDPVIAQLKSVTLSAHVGAAALAPETFDKSGDYVYVRDVPASALKGDSATIDFALDKSIPPGAVDQRELGVVVSAIGLEAK